MKNKIKFELRMNLSPSFATRTARLRFEMKMKYSRASNVFLDHEPSCVKLLDISEKSIFPSLVMWDNFKTVHVWSTLIHLINIYKGKEKLKLAKYNN